VIFRLGIVCDGLFLFFFGDGALVEAIIIEVG